MMPFLTALLAAASWWIFVGVSTAHEFEVGAGAVFATSIFLELVRRAEPLQARPTLGDLLQVARVPGSVLADSVLIVGLLIQDLTGGRRTDSVYRVARFHPTGDCERDNALRVLATAYSTVSPNCIALGVDRKQELLLYHQIKAAPLSGLTRRLLEAPR